MSTTDDRMHPPGPFHSRRRWALWASGPVAWLLVAALGPLPGMSGEGFARRVATPLEAALDRLSAPLPFSLAELLLALLILAALVTCVARLRRRSWSRRRRALQLLLDLLLVASPLWAVFQLGWAVHFDRPGLDERMAWPALEEDAVEPRLRELAGPLVEATNRAYHALHGQDDLGHPTRVDDRRAVDRALEESWRHLVREETSAHLGDGPRGPAKPLVLSPLFRRMGISGVFSPFTGEAHFVTSLPGCQLPMVLAHEKAHQRGVAPEDEATFLGFLAALRSDDASARYAALLYAQRHVLAALARRGVDISHWLGARSPGVQRDVDDRVAYWSRYRGATRRLATAMNDRYLKAHGEEGVRSYGRSLELLLRARTEWSASLDPPLRDSEVRHE